MMEHTPQDLSEVIEYYNSNPSVIVLITQGKRGEEGEREREGGRENERERGAGKREGGKERRGPPFQRQKRWATGFAHFSLSLSPSHLFSSKIPNA